MSQRLKRISRAEHIVAETQTLQQSAVCTARSAKAAAQLILAITPDSAWTRHHKETRLRGSRRCLAIQIGVSDDRSTSYWLSYKGEPLMGFKKIPWKRVDLIGQWLAMAQQHIEQ